jgi:anaerobic selenocysteine-containing dehydrogenase
MRPGWTLRRLPARLPRHLRAARHGAVKAGAIVQGGRRPRTTPPTHGALCTKVSRYAERTYHPERVLTPLRRDGPKGAGASSHRLGRGAGRHRRAAERHRRATTRRPSCPTATPAPWAWCRATAWRALLPPAGRVALLDRTICASAGGEALNRHLRRHRSACTWSTSPSRLILIWGSNSIASNLHFWTYAQQAKRAGAKLVCIDPRRTETADKCHQHIACARHRRRAGAGADARADRHDWLDHDYIEHACDGWRALRERALQWPPERAAAVCGIDAETMRQLARDYAT